MRRILRAVTFDFDGVLVDSVNVKSEGFAALYSSEGEAVQNLMRAYHTKNGGMPRGEKIKTFEEDILKRTITENDLNRKVTRFAEIVENLVAQSPEIPGASDALAYLAGAGIPAFIASATPQEELRRITDAREISRHFAGIFGSPVKKHEHLKNIIASQKISPLEILMIGDATADYEAAQTAGTPFLGIRTPEQDAIFPPGTPIMQDLINLPDWLNTHFKL